MKMESEITGAGMCLPMNLRDTSLPELNLLIPAVCPLPIILFTSSIINRSIIV
jgi:hypothetical protein